jgi:hypothetical protein
MGADFWIMATLFVGAMFMMRVSARASVQTPRERPGHGYRQMLLDRAQREAEEHDDDAVPEPDDDAQPPDTEPP